jgi:hypothetical protein
MNRPGSSGDSGGRPKFVAPDIGWYTSGQWLRLSRSKATVESSLGADWFLLRTQPDTVTVGLLTRRRCCEMPLRQSESVVVDEQTASLSDPMFEGS